MTILVTGCKGQLGSEIKVLVESTVDSRQLTNKYIFTDIEELDITDYKSLEDFCSLHKPEQIINCAAYTAVDKAEIEEKLARRINVKACSNLAKICNKEGIFLLHVSTDYVFDGNNFKPYKESDTTNPLCVYGRTKLEGEREIIRIMNNDQRFKNSEDFINQKSLISNPKSIIIRTSWLYSSFGNNFVKSIIKKAKLIADSYQQSAINVVYDQIGSPTYARDLAKAILEIIRFKDYHIQRLSDKSDKSDKSYNPVEIYHYSNEGVCSWYDFAKAIVELKNIPCLINPIETKDYPTPAKRPHYSVFSKDKIKNDFKINIPYWRDSLNDCIKVI